MKLAFFFFFQFSHLPRVFLAPSYHTLWETGSGHSISLLIFTFSLAFLQQCLCCFPLWALAKSRRLPITHTPQWLVPHKFFFPLVPNRLGTIATEPKLFSSITICIVPLKVPALPESSLLQFCFFVLFFLFSLSSYLAFLLRFPSTTPNTSPYVYLLSHLHALGPAALHMKSDLFPDPGL